MKSSSRIQTLGDARDQRARADIRSMAKSFLAARQREEDAAILRANPAIGKLVRRGREIFYAYVGGQYVESKSAATIADALSESAS